MPVIDLVYEELRRLSGLERPADWFIDNIPMTGASFEGSDGDTLRFEFFPNRPDHYSVEGVARTLRTLYSSPARITEYSALSQGFEVHVDRSVKKVRPVIVGAVITGLEFSDRMLKSLIELQEKLHLTVGRKRRKVAIGIHDVDRIAFPLKYAAYPGSGYAFSPLGFSEEMTLSRIIEEHEKGREFGWIVGDGPYPLITDSNGNVLSMPPIINGNITQLTAGTRDVFVDVTGLSFSACSGVLNIISTALADRGGRINSVMIVDGSGRTETPDLERRRLRLSLPSMNALLGVNVSGEMAIELLSRMGHSCTLQGNRIDALVQPFRMDVMHPVDLMEDAAISYGFGNFGSTAPRTQTVGSLGEMTNLSDLMSELMIGYGYSQVITFMISGRQAEFGRMRTDASPSVELLNPVLEENNMLRTSLLPGMLLLLEANKHNELPQKIFEIGDVHTPGLGRHFAAMSIHPKATFAECRSLADALIRDMKLGMRMESSSDPRFIEGRQMAMLLDGEHVGILGELHPEVITNFNLYNPIVALEFDMQKAFRLR